MLLLGETNNGGIFIMTVYDENSKYSGIQR